MDSEQAIEAARLAADPALRLSPDAGAGLLLLYQPIVRLRDRRLVMVEALARWGAADDRLVGADILVPAVERAGLEADLAAAVARRASAELAGLLPALGIGVSINLPLGVLERPDIASWIASHLPVPGRLRRRVALELTETAPVRDHTGLALALRRLRRAGHRVLLDDLQPGDRRGHLLRLPFSGVKIDRAAVEALAGSAHARHWLRCVVRAARRHGVMVTAEGVGDAGQWNALREAGVEQAQGYFVAPPLPAAELAGWAGRWRGGQPAYTRS